MQDQTPIEYDELTQFVAQKKLQELQRQRERLGERYAAIEREIALANSPAEKACILSESLEEIRLANQRLHRDLGDASMLNALVEAGGDTDAVASSWVRRLERELEKGKARAETAYLFGSVLAEHTGSSPPETPGDGQDPEDVLKEWRARTLQPSRSTEHGTLFDEVFDGFDSGALKHVREGVARILSDSTESTFARPIPPANLADVCSESDLASLHRISADPMTQKEFMDAMLIVGEDFEEWTWPESVFHQAKWTRNRWRIYPLEPVPDAVFAEQCGATLLDTVLNSLGEAFESRSSRLATLIELNAPDIIIENERRLVAEATSLGIDDDVGVFDELPECSGLDGIRALRKERLLELRRLSERGSDDDYENTVALSASLVAAEIRLQRSARPDQPVYVVKTDIREFFASVEHNVVLDLLERFGVPQKWIEFARRFLQIPIDGEPAQRGLPMGHRPSRQMADLLLRVLDALVRREANVRIIRAIDDICFLAADPDAVVLAYETTLRFLEACGLEINEAKSGSVVIGGPRPAAFDALPNGLPTWAILQLDSDGEWRIAQ